MSVVSKIKLPGTSRQAEEQHLAETLTIVRSNVEKYSQEVSKTRSGIDDMLAHFHDDNPELINELENMDTMYSFLKRTLERNERALKKPYFGRIDFQDETLGTQEAFYIGRSGISRDATHPVVIDWRAPVANTYYENGLGKCSYLSPDGKELQIDLQLKRTYEIEAGQLQNIFDTEVIANDDILTKYLSKNKQAVLGEIVATIQKEQNAIIRKNPFHNCLVQGVAGSGKTTVAMHRISYILYNYAERFHPEDFYIVGSNRILLNYITGVLPDLDVYGVRQMTMEQLFVRLLYEDWDENKYTIRSSAADGSKNMIKGTLAWFRDLEEFCRELEQEMILRESIYLNRKQFVEGFVDGKAGVHDRTGGKPANPMDLVLLMEGAAVERYIEQNPNISIQSKINMLNDRLKIRIKDEFLGKGVKYTEAERRAILKAYHGRYGANNWKKSIFAMYEEFLKTQADKGKEVDLPDAGIEVVKGKEVNLPNTGIDVAKERSSDETFGIEKSASKIAFDVYDLAALAYLYKRVKETEVISEAHHVVIDEAQDFGMMVYGVLKFCIKDCSYTIMGDVSQNIHFGYGLNDWEELKEMYLKDSRSSFGILKKSYRNTVEISDFATRILHHGRFAVYPVEPIIRHGNVPQVTAVKNRKELMEKAAAVCRKWQQSGLETIAVICRDSEGAQKTAKELGALIEVMESSLETAEFGNGIMVLPVEYTKGLEFDAVLILDPTRGEYPVDDGHAKLLYVAATRALHELCVLHRENLTGLIADPVPEGAMEIIEDVDSHEEVNGQSTVGKAKERNYSSAAGADKQKQSTSGNTEGQKQHASIRAERRNQSISEKTEGQKQRASIRAERRNQSISEKTEEQKNGRSGEPAGIRKRNLTDLNEGRELKNVQIPGVLSRQTSREKPSGSTQRTVMSGSGADAGINSIRSGTKSPLSKSELQPRIGLPTAGTAVKQSENRSGTTADQKTRRTITPQTVFAQPTSAGKTDTPFGSLPDMNLLRALGHGKTDQTVRWVAKQPDGLYLQSSYGVVRISPVASNIIRVTFARSKMLPERTHSLISLVKPSREWMYRDSGKLVEIKTDDLYLQVDKANGSIHYMTRDRIPLLNESSKECRLMEKTPQGQSRARLYLDWPKNEPLYALGAGTKAELSLKGVARYISHTGRIDKLPMVVSEKGYGLVMAADGPVFCCNIPTYGAHLCAESAEWLDYYFIKGADVKEIIAAYDELCGKK